MVNLKSVRLSCFCLLVLVSALLPLSALSSKFYGGPPDLTESFAISAKVFTGSVISVSKSQGKSRGDSIAKIAIHEVFKGSDKPESTRELSFNSTCPAGVRKSDCVRHTIKISAGDRLLFFTKDSDDNFTSKSYGTRPIEKISYILPMIREENKISYAEAVRRQVRERNAFIGLITDQKATRTSTGREHNSGDLTIQIIQPINGKFAPGESIDVTYGFYKYSPESDLHLQYSNFETRFLFVLSENSGGRKPLLSQQTVPLEKLEELAASIAIETEYKLKRKSREKRKTSVAAGGFIPGFWKHVDAFFSQSNLHHSADFDVGLRWNPDD